MVAAGPRGGGKQAIRSVRPEKVKPWWRGCCVQSLWAFVPAMSDPARQRGVALGKPQVKSFNVIPAACSGVPWEACQCTKISGASPWGGLCWDLTCQRSGGGVAGKTSSRASPAASATSWAKQRPTRGRANPVMQARWLHADWRSRSTVQMPAHAWRRAASCSWCIGSNQLQLCKSLSRVTVSLDFTRACDKVRPAGRDRINPEGMAEVGLDGAGWRQNRHCRL